MTQHQEEAAKQHKQANEQLAIAKKREAQLLQQGWKYIRLDDRTQKLVKPK